MRIKLNSNRRTSRTIIIKLYENNNVANSEQNISYKLKLKKRTDERRNDSELRLVNTE